MHLLLLADGVDSNLTATISGPEGHGGQAVLGVPPAGLEGLRVGATDPLTAQSGAGIWTVTLPADSLTNVTVHDLFIAVDYHLGV